ncbi:hypothetical protein EVAR_14865_1 [Eumeta japonica]|uniref:Uncharacterized protein n=1 Tax=Eumeta variegata TaxID=151549 RepID=A0A4C1V592_EUMVA|nr:hypothetical protein EVAR_14865_1 [Eumeta japonica]
MERSGAMNTVVCWKREWGCVRPLSLFYSDASADGVEERSLVPRSRSHARFRRNATMSHAFSGGARRRRRRRPPTASRLKGPRKQKSFAYKLLKRGLAKSFAYKLLKRDLANLMSPTSTSGVAPPLILHKVTRARRTASADWWITPSTAGMRPRDLFTTSRDYRESRTAARRTCISLWSAWKDNCVERGEIAISAESIPAFKSNQYSSFTNQ